MQILGEKIAKNHIKKTTTKWNEKKKDSMIRSGCWIEVFGQKWPVITFESLRRSNQHRSEQETKKYFFLATLYLCVFSSFAYACRCDVSLFHCFFLLSIWMLSFAVICIPFWNWWHHRSRSTHVYVCKHWPNLSKFLQQTTNTHIHKWMMAKPHVNMPQQNWSANWLI